MFTKNYFIKQLKEEYQNLQIWKDNITGQVIELEFIRCQYLNENISNLEYEEEYANIQYYINLYEAHAEEAKDTIITLLQIIDSLS